MYTNEKKMNTITAIWHSAGKGKPLPSNSNRLINRKNRENTQLKSYKSLIIYKLTII